MYIFCMTQQRAVSIGSLVWHLSIKWRVMVDRALRQLGLTHAHYAVIASLDELSSGGIRPSQRELADFAGLDVMYVSKLVRTLERAEVLRRRDHPDDPRAFQLELSEKGIELVQRAAAVVGELYDQMLAPIGGRASEQAAVLIQALESLLDQADAAVRASRAARAVAPLAKGRGRVS